VFSTSHTAVALGINGALDMLALLQNLRFRMATVFQK